MHIMMIMMMWLMIISTKKRCHSFNFAEKYVEYVVILENGYCKGRTRYVKNNGNMDG